VKVIAAGNRIGFMEGPQETSREERATRRIRRAGKEMGNGKGTRKFMV
jgi:hypothetical protein